MHAVVMKGGKQYAVSPGTVLHIEKLEGAKGDRVSFDDVLIVNNNGEVTVGTPTVEGVPVIGEILDQYKAKKILVVKKKRRKGYRRIQGHRQNLTDIKIISIGDVTTKVPVAVKTEVASNTPETIEEIETDGT